MSHVRTAEALAEWCVALDPASLPADIIAKAEDCILDAVACAFAGAHADATARVATVAASQYRDGPAQVWFDGAALHATGAAFVNANAASILDLDDGHRLPCGHPGAAAVPAALAMAQEAASDGIEVLAAVVAGYEICARIGGAENRIAYHSGNWTGFGVAAVAARLRRMSAEQLAHALAVTAYHGPRVADLTLSADMGANVKETIPWSVVTGMNAAELAAEGFTGCLDALDIDERFRPGQALTGLGDGFMIERTYFKRYSACRWIHAAVEALVAVMAEFALSAGDIERVRVETFHQAASLNNLTDPPSAESAQYSIPFCLGLAATKGEGALMPMREADLHDPAAVAFAECVTVVRDNGLAARFPETVPARLHIETASGHHEHLVERPWGEPATGIGRADLVAKFEILADGRMSGQRVDAIVAAVEALKHGGTGTLTGLLAQPPAGDVEPAREAANG